MNRSPDHQTIEEIAIELGVDPAFIEKDWHAVRIVKAIAEVSHDDITPVFSGGTSLSKGYELIKRFSEDLDFRACTNSEIPPNRTRWRAFKKSILSAVASVSGMVLADDKIKAGSNYFKVQISYDNLFNTPASIRRHLQLEFSYTPPRRTTLIKPVSSIINQFIGDEAETRIPCLNPLETASDKLSALTWRTLKRDRASADDDPAIVRHLHDLCALAPLVESDPEFPADASAAYGVDMGSARRRLDKTLPQAARTALKRLSTDSEWQREYERFVTGTSYADEKERIPYSQALNALEMLIERLERI